MQNYTALFPGANDFLYVKVSSGATIAFDVEPEETPARVHVKGGPGVLGTLWCNSCVGVYFPLDDKRCFLAHINALSASRQPRNTVDEAEGKEIQDLVFQQLVREMKSMQWDTRDKYYASIVVVCAPNLERKWGEMRKTMVGTYVVEAIREFFLWNSDCLLEDAENAFDKAKKAAVVDADDSEMLLGEIRAALESTDDEERREELAAAQELAHECTELEDQSSYLLEKAHFAVRTGGPHGFLVHRNLREGAIAIHWIGAGARESDWTPKQLPARLVEEGWGACEVPYEDWTREWYFSSIAAWKLKEGRTLEERRHDYWEFVHIEDRLVASTRSDDELAAKRGRSRMDDKQIFPRRRSEPNKERQRRRTPDRTREFRKELAARSFESGNRAGEFQTAAPGSGEQVTLPERPRQQSPGKSMAALTTSKPSSSTSNQL
ncbi:uncharacterized protein LTR77_001996 [Saxophila tyrrhenica]|uniref:Uncharacterized protein n=1 Tax=Saxophila tyrrhenica TaxID=1690608 RepID=A0AAV9PHY0_9PEZI|nr:hypothetical protein LTR77_001996 [Saxophila tyrrhenica]